MTGDNQGSRGRPTPKSTPGCGYPFGAGPTTTSRNARPLTPTATNPNDTVDNDDHVSGLGYADHNKPGSFLNGFMTGGLRGISRWEGSEGDTAGNRDDCRQVLARLAGHPRGAAISNRA